MPAPVSRTGTNDRKAIMETAAFLKVIADENRLRILRFLRHGERCVCEI